MCQININLSTTTPAGTTITSATGKYRLLGASTWTFFNITNFTNAVTPNITTLGMYEMEINVSNSAGVTSDPAYGTFTISENCGGGTSTSTNDCVTYNITNGTQSDLTYSFIPCGSSTTTNAFMGGFETVSICVAPNTTPTIETGLSLSQAGTCSDGGTTTTTTTTTTPTGVFSVGTCTNASVGSSSAPNPNSNEITGTLVVTGGPKRYTVNVKNQYNAGNDAYGYLEIRQNGGTLIGTASAQTTSSTLPVESVGTIVVPVGTYTYKLRATVRVNPPQTGGAATACIVDKT